MSETDSLDGELLRESLDRLMRGEYAFEQRKAHALQPEGWSRSVWRALAETGLLGLPFATHDGGIGGGPAEVAIAMEAFGRALLLEPYLAHVVLAGGAIDLAANATQKQRWLPGLISGQTLHAFAHAEPQSRYSVSEVATRAHIDARGWVLNGDKAHVIHGDCADRLIVSARVAGASDAESGLRLFMVDACDPGVSRRSFMMQDGVRAAHIRLSDVRVSAQDCLGGDVEAFAAIEHVVDRGIAAIAAESVGVLESMHALTVDYLKTRKQFGVPIGSFQVLQHRAVDMLVAADQARSMALYASLMVDHPDRRERRRALSAAKVQIGRSARQVGQQAIQLHGGIGLAYEYQVGHYFLRSTAIELLFGDADHHLSLLARAGGLIDE